MLFHNSSLLGSRVTELVLFLNLDAFNKVVHYQSKFNISSWLKQRGKKIRIILGWKLTLILLLVMLWRISALQSVTAFQDPIDYSHFGLLCWSNILDPMTYRLHEFYDWKSGFKNYLFTLTKCRMKDNLVP